MPPTPMSPQLTAELGRATPSAASAVTGDVFGALIESAAAVTVTGAALR